MCFRMRNEKTKEYTDVKIFFPRADYRWWSWWPVLAQGLKKAGISVAVYERDRSSNDRLQGYRIHIEPQGTAPCMPVAT